MAEMCLAKERLESNLIPRLQASEDGLTKIPWKVMDGERTLDRCCGVLIKRYSVLVGLTERWFEVSQ